MELGLLAAGAHRAGQEEWAQGRFDTVPGDMEEFIPLPETQEKPRRATGAVFYP